MNTEIKETLDRNVLVATQLQPISFALLTEQVQAISSDSSMKVPIIDEEKIDSIDQVGDVWHDEGSHHLHKYCTMF